MTRLKRLLKKLTCNSVGELTQDIKPSGIGGLGQAVVLLKLIFTKCIMN